MPKAAIIAQVKKIVDGDTIHVVSKGRTLKVRLPEIDAPRAGPVLVQRGGREGQGAAAGREARLSAPGPRPKDPYGRYLFYAWSYKGTFVNRYLVRYGYARAVLYKPNDKYITLMRAEEARAKRQRLGIWSGRCATGGSAKPKTTARTGTDPRFRTCAEANRNGYGPYYRGRDPEYAWYQDRDGDGVVCEPR